MNKHYNCKLFIMGVFLNTVKHFFLWIPAAVLLVVGIWNRICLWISLGLIGLNLIISFAEQLQNKTVIENDDDPEFRQWKDAMMSDDWQSEVKGIVEEKIKNGSSTDGDGSDRQ